jgi:hypothetical protein
MAARVGAAMKARLDKAARVKSLMSKYLF